MQIFFLINYDVIKFLHDITKFSGRDDWGVTLVVARSLVRTVQGTFFSIFVNRYHLPIFDRLHQIIGPRRKNCLVIYWEKIDTDERKINSIERSKIVIRGPLTQRLVDAVFSSRSAANMLNVLILPERKELPYYKRAIITR